MNNRPLHPFVVLLAVWHGAAALLVQVCLVRAGLAAWWGNERVVALVFTVWFAGIAAGALLAGRWCPAPARAAAWAAGVGIALPLAGLGGVWVLRAFRWLADTPPGLHPTTVDLLTWGATAILAPAVLVGIGFPLLAAAARVPDRPAGQPAGLVYWAEAAGAVWAGAAHTLLLAGRVAAPQLLWAAATLIALLVALRAPSRRWAGAALGLATLLTGLGLGGLPGWLDNQSTDLAWSRTAPGHQLVDRRETPRQHLALGERDGQFTLFHDGLPGPPFPDPGLTAPRVHLHMAQNRPARSVLLVGGGLEEEVTLLLRYPLRRLTCVIDDPAYPQMLGPHLPPAARAALADPRLVIRLGDAPAVLAEDGPNWDRIVLLAPPPASLAANRYHTREFIERCARRLNPGGVLVTRLSGGVTMLGPEVGPYLATLRDTLAAVFPEVRVTPGPDHLFLAAAGGLSLDAAVLAGRLPRRLAGPEALHWAAYLPSLLPAAEVAWLEEGLSDIPPAPPNTTRRPTLVRRHLRLAAAGGEPGAAGPADRLAAVGPLPLLGGLACLATLLAVIRRRGGRLTPASDRLLAQTSVAAMGTFGLWVSLMVLYGYQCAFGSLYTDLGLLVGLFMLGLCGGAWWVNTRWRPGPSAARRLLGRLLPPAAAGLALLAGGSFGLDGPGGWAVVVLTTALAGGLTGMAFPAAGTLYAAASGRPAAAVAARLDAWDHLGALLGAGLGGALWLPVLGVDSATPALVLVVLLPAAVALHRPGPVA